MNVYMLAIYAVLFLVLWFVLIRPASKRNKAMRLEQSTAGVGSEVMLTSGIFGRVAAVDEDAAKISVEIAPGVVIRVARIAIATVMSASAEDETGNEATDPVEPAANHEGTESV